MKPKAVVGSTILATVMFADCAFAERRAQALVPQHLHVEISIERPSTIDVSSPGASGNRHEHVKANDAFPFSDFATSV